MDQNPRAVIGGNNPPPFERLTVQVDEYTSGARKVATDYSEIKDQETADKFEGFYLQLRAAYTEAEKERKSEKQPHLDAGAAVDEKWNGLKKKIEKSSEFVTGPLTKWKQDVKRKKEAAEAEARAAAAEAKRKADEAAAEAAKLAAQAQAGELAGTDADPIAASLKADELKKEAKGLQREASTIASAPVSPAKFMVDGKAKAVTMRTYYSAIITDPKAALAYFRKDQRILDALQTVCNEAVRKDHDNPPPGVEVHSEQRI